MRSKKRPIVIASVVVFVLLVAIYSNKNQSVPGTSTKEISEQSSGANFIKTGNLIKNNPGFKKDVWYLTYSQPGFSAASVELNFTQNSVCKSQEKDKHCDPDKFTQGQRVKISGFKTNDSVNINTLEIVDGQATTVNSKETTIDWALAKTYIKNCSVKSVVQSHDLTVKLTHKDKRVLTTKEPKIDDIFKEINTAKSKCGNIKSATE